MNADRFIATASTVGLIALAGCAGVEWTTQAMESDSIQYSNALKMTKNRVTVTVFWKDDSEIAKFCNNGGNACAVLNEHDAECIIYTPKPRSWNSATLQKRLGHEMLHCFGGKHE